jgi:hypothetical protein
LNVISEKKNIQLRIKVRSEDPPHKYLINAFLNVFIFRKKSLCTKHGRMARDGHGLPIVSLGPAMPYPSTPYGRATPETASRLFHGWQSSTPLDTPRRTLMARSFNTFLKSPKARYNHITQSVMDGVDDRILSGRQQKVNSMIRGTMSQNNITN